MNHVKAYILGLLVGGGKLDKNTFLIDLPFNKWGMNPERMNIIAGEILTKICQNFNSTYNFNVTYEIGNNKWLIKPLSDIDISVLIQDLRILGLPTSGFLLSTANLTIAKSKLSGINVEAFLSGIFDTRASLTLSHRRFNDDAPVVSIEIPGSTKNFNFIIQLCSWLTDLGSITDQILYNHPNQHAASDPDYKGWKKGFKIRFLVKSFLAQHSFALQAKSIDISKIEKNQKREEQIPCILRKLKNTGAVTVHNDQNSADLPPEVRNKLFFHYHHFCAVLNCHHAPKEEILKLVTESSRLINFFPTLAKGEFNELNHRFNNIRNSYFSEVEIAKKKAKIESLIYNESFKKFTSLNVGIAFLFAEVLKGKRHAGSMKEILETSLKNEVTVYSIGKDFDNIILVVNMSNNRAFLCSTVSSRLNQQMISKYIKVEGLSVNIIQNE